MSGTLCLLLISELLGTIIGFFAFGIMSNLRDGIMDNIKVMNVGDATRTSLIETAMCGQIMSGVCCAWAVMNMFALLFTMLANF